VAQGWAGLGFGIIALPRVGQEVLVTFLAGDPDRPMVVGRVFDAINPVPYKLPEHKTQSGWRTWSSPRHRAADQTPYNELKFEDDAGKEFIYLQAQRDRHQLVKHNEVVRVRRHHVRTVEQNQHLTVKKTKRELIEVDDHLHVKGNRAQAIDGSTSLKVGVDQDVVVGTKHALEAGKEIHLKAGTTIVIESGSKLSLKGPGGFIDIHPGGIDIAGTLVRINSGGSPATGSGASPKAPKDAMPAEPQDESAPDAQYDEG
jgi:type VI secretion system secreted protein VgrG